jgi:hypothetical protein
VKQISKYLIGLIFLIAGCGKDEFVPTDTGIDYFPLQVGMVWTYVVDETIYSEVVAPRQSNYRIEVKVADSVLNAEGTYTYILHRAKQNLQDMKWEALPTWSVRKNDREVVLMEGNIAFKKLMFPVKDNLAWNGNEYNNLGEDLYSFTSVDEPIEFEGVTWENTLTIEQENNDDPIVFFDQREEIYAKNTGLLKQSLKQLNYCTTEDCIGQQKIKSGRIYLQKLVSYDKE